MRDIIFDACMKYENYPIEIVGEDVFYSYYILYQNFKIRQKLKNDQIVEKAWARWEILYLLPV